MITPMEEKSFCFFAAYGILMTNGLTGLQMLLDALCAHGLLGVYSLEGLEILNPFGTYANMLGFFPVRAWLHTAPTFAAASPRQRLLGLPVIPAWPLRNVGRKDLYQPEPCLGRNPPRTRLPPPSGCIPRAGIPNLKTSPSPPHPPKSNYRRCQKNPWNLLSPLDLRLDAGPPAWPLLFPTFSIWTNLLKTLLLIIPALLLTLLLEKSPSSAIWSPAD